MTENEPTAVAAEPSAAAEPAAASEKKSKPTPPTEITVDTSNAKEEPPTTGDEKDGKTTPEEKTMGQARTPKHANKSRDEDSKETHSAKQQQITPERQTNVKGAVDQYGRPMTGPPPRPPYGGFSPPRPYEGRPLGGSGAFQPHESRQPGRNDPPAFYNGPGGRPPMHVSPPHGPSHGEYRPGFYGQGPPEYHRNGGPGGYPSFDQRGPPYGHDGPAPSGGPYRPPPGGQYRGPPYPPSYSGYEQSNNPAAWGGPSYNHRRPPPYPGMPPLDYQRAPSNTHDSRYVEQQQAGGNNTFSRAVSSSFGSRTDEKPGAMGIAGNPQGTDQKMEASQRFGPPHGSSHAQQQDSSVGTVGENSDDNSWKQLNQVASVDEAVMRERIGKSEDNNSGIKVDDPASNSSSLTNSPTEGHATAGAAKRIPTPSKLASLDSLSSVASAQEPLTTSKDKTSAATNSVGHLSPGSSASLDLMKCSSGSSGLLHLASQGLSFPPGETRLDTKRSRDEERGDLDTSKGAEGKELPRAPADPRPKEAGEPRPTKRGRADENVAKDGKYKESPLSIACSPPHSPSGKSKGDGRRKTGAVAAHPGAHLSGNKPHDRYSHQSPGSYFDKAPSYTYSMDSAPPFPKDSQRPSGYPPLPHRPGSSSSSTITPMQVEGHDAHQPSGVGPSLPSWEIQQQDSFSGGSAGGGAPLMNSFSFSQDYPMLSSSGSNIGAYTDHGGALPGQPPAHSANAPAPTGQTLESRNQSFEGGHYHGSFSRSESMDMSYGSHRPHGPPYGDTYRSQHHQPGYIHHALSWGSHGPPPGAQNHYGQYPRIGHSASFSQGGPGPMMRNYSEERVSPPPGPPGMRLGSGGNGQGRSGFQPPPEFMAPHNPHLSARRPSQAVYLMSSPPGGHGNQQSKSAGGNFSWSKDDDIRLTEIMKKYKNPRDWEPIAKEHGRGRT